MDELFLGRATQGHARLRDFLASTELTAADLARLAGLSPMQLSHLIRGRRRASLDVAARLEDATQGAVTMRSWLKTAD